MIVTFFGHAQILQREEIEKWLYVVTENLIEQGAITFYLGGYGAFDSLAASVLRVQKKRYPHIELVLVLAYLNTGRNTSDYDSTLYPPLETVPRRFAIPYRNRWMVESADAVVAYVLHDWGGAATTLWLSIIGISALSIACSWMIFTKSRSRIRHSLIGSQTASRRFFDLK